VKGTTAADCRAAVGRAYYAVFNVGAEHLRRGGISISRGGAAHGEVRQCLANAGDHAVAGAAFDLREMHTVRIRADYQLDRTDVETQANVRPWVTRAGEMIAVLDAAFLGPGRQALIDAIRAWRRANGYP
jgi:hypothetical protein